METTNKKEDNTSNASIMIETTFKENYPLLAPYSRAAIINDVNGEIKYLLLEPTLTPEDENTIRRIKDILWAELTVNTGDLKDKEEAEAFLKQKVQEVARKYKLKVDPQTLEKYQYYITRDYLNYAKIDGMMRDEFIEDISCDGIKRPIYIWHRKYESIKTNISFETNEELTSFVTKLAYLCGRPVSIAQPLLDGSLPEGSRVQLTYGAEVTPKGSSFTIRKFKRNPLTIIDLINYNTLSSEMAAYFWFLTENRHSVMIGGDIGGGKTTMLNAFSLFIRPNLKIVSIEDTQEIQLPHENWEVMVTRQGLTTGGGAIGEEGRGSISMFDLLRAALRQRPDYIIVGEIRGEEAFALFQAMSTGHLGLTTIHSETVQNVLHRLTTKPMDIPETLIENLDSVAIIRRMSVNGVSLRRVREVSEIVRWDNAKGDFEINQVFSWNAKDDSFEYSGKSYLLDEIAGVMGYTDKKIQEELKMRKTILDYMVRNNIRSYKEVSSTIMDYFADPMVVYRRAMVS